MGSELERAVLAAAGELAESIRAEAALRRGCGEAAEVGGAEPIEGAAWSATCIDLRAVEELGLLARRLIFPGFFEPADRRVSREGLADHVRALTSRVAAHIVQQVEATGREAGGRSVGEWGREVAAAFVSRLAEVRRLLALDVMAAYEGDPAAESTDEVVLCYPGVAAMMSHRVAHELYRLDVPVLPRLISEQSHARTGIDIHPGAQIGESFFIDHGSGVVIGETAVIGRGVKIYQGVTLGARSFPRDAKGRIIKGQKRHPTIGDRVTIYAGAVILGGDTVIGDDCVIAGGVFVTESVPAGSLVQQPRAELKVRRRGAQGGADVEGLVGGAGI